VDDISTILIKGNPSEFQKPLIDAISGVVKVKNLDEFRMVVKTNRNTRRPDNYNHE
jgi:hypothetical protein